MSDLAGLLEVAANNTVTEVRLQPETLTVLLYALDKIRNPLEWSDYWGEYIPDADKELIHELVDLAADDIVRPIVMTPVGAILMWQEVVPPSNWLLCDGGAAFVAEWPELFALWGYKYGGSGTQFGLPDLADFSPMGQGGTVGLDAMAGSLTHTLTIAQMPSHDHRIPKASATASAINTSTPSARTDNVAAPTMRTDGTGGSSPHPILHPVYGTNFIVHAGKQVT